MPMSGYFRRKWLAVYINKMKLRSMHLLLDTLNARHLVSFDLLWLRQCTVYYVAKIYFSILFGVIQYNLSLRSLSIALNSVPKPYTIEIVL